MAVRLWPTLPKDHELNGLAALERPLLDDPAGPYYVVAEVNRRRATIDDDEDATTPTIRVLHGEALAGEHATAARQLLRQAQEKRCGKRQPDPPELPYGDDPVQRHIDLGDDPDGDADDGDQAVPDAPDADDDE